MREKPVLKNESLAALLQEAYGLPGARLEFLPIGADINAAKYRVVTPEPACYFLKAKRGYFAEVSLLLPQFLHAQGLRQVIPPVRTKDGRLWSTLEDFTCILYPYIEGRSGFDVELSQAEWIKFGSVIRRIHSMSLPPALQARVPTETWSPHCRQLVRGFQAQVQSGSYADPLAAQMAAFLRRHAGEIRSMLDRAEELAGELSSRSLDRVLCHSDLHAGNLLHSDQADLHIIDWDEPILAPRERDLMFIGGGVGGIWNSPEEAAWFYQGYGAVDIDLAVLAYYRFERILVDVVEYSRQLLSSADGLADRERGLQQFTAAFLPNDVVEIAFQTYQRLKEGQ